MTINKQALREAAQEEIMLRSVSDTSDAWQDEASPEAVLALLDELEAAEKRIAELEAKLANPVLLPKTNGYWNEQEKAYEEAITLAKRQVRLAGFRCEGDE
ncbi:TPA: ead/Ea22-like family protein [Citrobacter braakii]|uniref:ead/Ea22-like family protein n=1 Tax=Citrobacter TaxID=544 RepID=UPI00201759E3|nr:MULTISPECIES: ead/Ea22-like family protein [Citrobacter]MDW2593091.1 ead/Ea22-like family protein [Citrobacter braakii]MDW2656843.1 ead/Ea22-like family protein [Citrobacter braakii]MDW2704619.1 ead/Ea22-like family protein [Citrobacter braakii]